MFFWGSKAGLESRSQGSLGVAGMPCPNHPKGIDQEIKGMVPEKVDDENASPIEGIVVKWDLEADMPQKGAREVRRPCGCSRKCWAMMGCCSVSLLAVVVCTCSLMTASLSFCYFWTPSQLESNLFEEPPKYLFLRAGVLGRAHTSSTPLEYTVNTMQTRRRVARKHFSSRRKSERELSVKCAV